MGGSTPRSVPQPRGGRAAGFPPTGQHQLPPDRLARRVRGLKAWQEGTWSWTGRVTAGSQQGSRVGGSRSRTRTQVSVLSGGRGRGHWAMQCPAVQASPHSAPSSVLQDGVRSGPDPRSRPHVPSPAPRPTAGEVASHLSQVMVSNRAGCTLLQGGPSRTGWARGLSCGRVHRATGASAGDAPP